MTPAGWESLILRAARDFTHGDTSRMQRLCQTLYEMDQALELLRGKGYGDIGMSLLTTIKTQVPTIFHVERSGTDPA